MKKIVVLSGAGISAESGIATFRDSDGLWEGYNVTEVATPEGFAKNPALVLEFYNQRRRAGKNAKPNEAHFALKRLEEFFEVQIITQNIDNLHEQAGSSNVLHLHGELFKMRSTKNPDLVFDMEGTELVLGDLCPLGSQLRPNIVWFGEAVPMMAIAVEHARNADFFIVVGTSMVVYPAAGLLNYAPEKAQKFVVDVKKPTLETNFKNLEFIENKASIGLSELAERLIKAHK